MNIHKFIYHLVRNKNLSDENTNAMVFLTLKGGKMSEKLKSSALRVQEALQDNGLTCEIVQMQDTTRTAEDAARAVGCVVGQIVKSLVFEGKQLPASSGRYQRCQSRQ